MSINDRNETRSQGNPPPRPVGPPPRTIFENETRSKPDSNRNK